MDQLEESMSKAEKELDPNKLRKVFSALPGLVSVIQLPTTCDYNPYTFPYHLYQILLDSLGFSFQGDDTTFPVTSPHKYFTFTISFFSLPPFHTPQRRSTSKPDPTSNWQPPKLFKTRDYFSSSGSASSPGHAAVADEQARALEDNR